MGIISEENLLRLNFSEQVDMPRLEEFSLNTAPEVRSVLLTFEHVEDGANVFLRATEQVE